MFAVIFYLFAKVLTNRATLIFIYDSGSEVETIDNFFYLKKKSASTLTGGAARRARRARGGVKVMTNRAPLYMIQGQRR